VKGIKEFFFKKGIDELQLDRTDSQMFMPRTGPNPVFQAGQNVGSLFSMPSMREVRQYVKKAGKNTLKEVELVTIEKLSNKILR
jgi:hypothetical protein